MPTTMTADEPRRWRSVLMPTLATELACRPRRVSASQAASNTASSSAPGQGGITQTAITTIRSNSSKRFLRKAMDTPAYFPVRTELVLRQAQDDRKLPVRPELVLRQAQDDRKLPERGLDDCEGRSLSPSTPRQRID